MMKKSAPALLLPVSVLCITGIAYMSAADEPQTAENFEMYIDNDTDLLRSKLPLSPEKLAVRINWRHLPDTGSRFHAIAHESEYPAARRQANKGHYRMSKHRVAGYAA